MPLQTYHIVPINVSNNPVIDQRGNELECVTNLTLADLLRQLGSISEQSSRIFEDLTQTAKKLNERAKLANKRIENIQAKCKKLDFNTESSTTLQEFYDTKPFKSSVNFDQKMFTEQTRSEAIQLLYNNAEPPPDLNKLIRFR